MTVVFYLHNAQGGHPRYVFHLAASVSQFAPSVVLTAPGCATYPGVGVVEAMSPIDLGAEGWRRIDDRIRVYSRHPLELERALAPLRGHQLDVCHLQNLPSVFPSRMVR